LIANGLRSNLVVSSTYKPVKGLIPLGYSCGPNIGSVVAVGNNVAVGVAVSVAGTMVAAIVSFGIGGGSVASSADESSEIDLDDVVGTICAALSGFGESGSRPQDTNSMILNTINSCVIQVTCKYLLGLAKGICQYIV
jgi:hypothetical protein